MLTKNIEHMKSEVARHIAADAVVAGRYWEEVVENSVGGAGCFIGCLAHSSDAEKLTELYGIPLPLTRICEGIFEGISITDKKAGVDFFEAIPIAIAVDGKDLSLVHWAFLASELRAFPTQQLDIQAVIDPVIAGMDFLASGKEWPKDAADAAADAFGRAAITADNAGRAAAYAAGYAAAAGRSSHADNVAARAADVGIVASIVAFRAARAAIATNAAARIRQRNTIIRLISEAPCNA